MPLNPINKAIETRYRESTQARRPSILSAQPPLTYNEDSREMGINQGGFSYIANLQYAQFDTSLVTPADGIGRLTWNETEGTLNLGLAGGNVILQVGQEQVQRINNRTGAAFIDGQVVYVNGSQGNRLTAALALGTNDMLSARTFGVVTEPIANNQSGFVTTSGLVRNIDTSALPEGAAVYLSPTVPGGLTATRPTAPNHAVLVGWCVRQHATVGMIFVHVQNGFELDELHNVSIATPAEDEVLVYNFSTSLWENRKLDLDDLGNVTLTSIANGDILVYNSTSGKWENQPNSGGGSTTLDGLTDVTVTAPADGDILTYDSATSEWINLANTGGGSTTLDGLTDVAVTTPAHGDILTYDSATSQWVNLANSGGAVALDDLTDVTINSASIGDTQAIIYNAATGQWENLEISPRVRLDSLADVDTASAPSDRDVLVYDMTTGKWKHIQYLRLANVSNITFQQADTSVLSPGGQGQYQKAITPFGSAISYATYQLVHLWASDTDLRIRVYSDPNSRTADASRALNVEPANGVGLVLEYITYASPTDAMLSPMVVGFSANSAQSGDPFGHISSNTMFYITVDNLSTTVTTFPYFSFSFVPLGED